MDGRLTFSLKQANFYFDSDPQKIQQAWDGPICLWSQCFNYFQIAKLHKKQNQSKMTN